MKKTIFGFLALAIFTFLADSCKLLDKLTQFDINYSTDFVVPTGSLVNLPIDLGQDELTTNSAQTYENNNTSTDHIKEVHLKSLALTITSPSGVNFSFLKSAQIFLSASGLPEKMVASIDNNTSTSTTINLTPTGDDLKDYLAKSSFTLREVVTTKNTPTQDIHIRADAVFSVQGKILK